MKKLLIVIYLHGHPSKVFTHRYYHTAIFADAVAFMHDMS